MSRELLHLSRNDLACYGLAVRPGFEAAPHIKAIVSRLEDIEAGRIKRLMILTAPRHGKSMITSEIFPAWYLGRHPDRYVVGASYSSDLAGDFGRKVRNTIADAVHGAIFPECQLSEDSGGAQKFATTKGGAYFAVGRGAGLTGRGAHVLIIDDAIRDRAEADSEVIRKGLHEWFSSVAYTRLMPGGAIVIVQTMWHEDDLAGRLLREQSGEWTVLNLPAIAEENDVLGRKAGEALWPERYPLATLEKIRTVIGSAAFVSLYQQRPSAATGKRCSRQQRRCNSRLRILEPYKCTLSRWIACSRSGRKASSSALGSQAPGTLLRGLQRRSPSVSYSASLVPVSSNLALRVIVAGNNPNRQLM